MTSKSRVRWADKEEEEEQDEMVEMEEKGNGTREILSHDFDVRKQLTRHSRRCEYHQTVQSRGERVKGEEKGNRIIRFAMDNQLLVDLILMLPITLMALYIILVERGNITRQVQPT